MNAYELANNVQTQTHDLNNIFINISLAIELLATNNTDQSVEKYIEIIDKSLIEYGKAVNEIESLCDKIKPENS